MAKFAKRQLERFGVEPHDQVAGRNAVPPDNGTGPALEQVAVNRLLAHFGIDNNCHSAQRTRLGEKRTGYRAAGLALAKTKNRDNVSGFS